MEALAFWGYVEPVEISLLEFETVAPGSSDDVRLRVVNLSDTYTAAGVTVAVADTDQLFVSSDGDVFTVSIDLGSLPPTSMSAPFWLRRVTPSTAAGEYTGIVRAEVDAWASPISVTGAAGTGPVPAAVGPGFGSGVYGRSSYGTNGSA
jgi:hypothetical protein